MKFPGKGIMLDFGKGSVITVALFISYIILPLVGLIPGVFTPLPAMFYTLKSGRGVGIAIVIATASLLIAIAGPVITLFYLIQGGLISVALPHFLLKGHGGIRSVVSSVAVGFSALLLVAVIAWQYYGLDVHQVVLKWIDTGISQTTPLYEKSGLKEEEILALKQEAKQVIGRIYPALAIILLGAIAGLNLQAFRRMAAKLGRPFALAELSNFRNPDHLVWFVIIPGFALLINNAGVVTAALNILVVTLSLYFIQGLAVILSLFERHSVPGFIRVTFYVLLALQPFMAAGLAALGVFDLWGNFRTPRQHKNL
jgi:uncharacterized protein YybS (DUF2232 family)